MDGCRFADIVIVLHPLSLIILILALLSFPRMVFRPWGVSGICEETICVGITEESFSPRALHVHFACTIFPLYMLVYILVARCACSSIKEI